MRIVQLIDSLYIGGAERLQVTFAEVALSRGMQPTIMTVVPARVRVIANHLTSLGLDVLEFNDGNLLDFKRFISLIRALRRGQYDLIHAHLVYSIILGALAGFITGIPVVATLHNIKSNRFPWLELISLRYGVKKIIAVGNAVADSYQPRLRGSSLIIVDNPVREGVALSMDARVKIRKELSGHPSRPILISVGRLEAQKGYSDLIIAMKHLHEVHPQAFLVIVGIGTLMDQIQEQIETEGLQECVRLLGARDDVPQLLASSDVYVVSSHWEGMPISVLEAMQAALPIVATHVGDIPTIMKCECGMLVPPHEPKSLADALLVLLKDSARCKSLGLNGLSYVRERHNTDIWFDKLVEIYREVLPKNDQT
jgi:glycosyltransferase involved in cell wall biosynthesis